VPSPNCHSRVTIGFPPGSLVCAQLVERLAEDGLGDHPTYAQADQLETHAWRLFVSRIRTIAGE